MVEGNPEISWPVHGEGEVEELEQAHVVLFPWLVEAVGLLVFFVLARYLHGLPYTAVMFVIGLFMGIGAIRSGKDDLLSESIRRWSNIDSEVLLLVFLPGLVFRDALNVNFHLFTICLPQILILAFPAVLAGTVLTACVAYYAFPYNWSWFLSLTFGSILSATDPVAVAALLAEVGAPPRLTMHISGESMFNDGSAMVFFNIFSGMFLHELKIEGLGDTVSLAEGFAIFFRLSLGGVAIGIAFALGLVFVLYVLDQRLNTENNVVQVAATVTVAYLTFFVSEIAAGCSGVLAVVMCGITTRAFGAGFINDRGMMEDFWVLLEHLLNTLLFTLGGVVFGTVIANTDERDSFDARDWGFLCFLYVCLHIIRFGLIGFCYPLVSRIGLKTNWQESLFMGYGGLRGAVGIALAIALDNDVRSKTDDPEQLAYTNRLFGMVGGVSLLTLVINGTLAGPILKKLGLAKSSETAKIISEHYQRLLKRLLIRYLAILLNDSRFAECSYSIVRHHLRPFVDATDDEINAAMEAAKLHKENRVKLQELSDAFKGDSSSQDHLSKLESSEGFANELRLLFLQLLRGAYAAEMSEGFLDARLDNGLVHFSLTQSLDFAADEVNRGGAIEDWKFVNLSEFSKLNAFAYRISKFRSTSAHATDRKRTRLLKALAFQTAHRNARRVFQSEVIEGASSVLTEVAQQILKESEAQEGLASEVVKCTKQADLQIFVSHYACDIILSKCAELVHRHNRSGMLRDQEAHIFLEEIDKTIKEIRECSLEHKDAGHIGNGIEGSA